MWSMFMSNGQPLATIPTFSFNHLADIGSFISMREYLQYIVTWRMISFAVDKRLPTSCHRIHQIF
jgi:hypothetical protein